MTKTKRLTYVRKLIPGQLGAHPVPALALTLEDPARRVGGETHPVSNDEDDVLGHPLVGLQQQGLAELWLTVLQPVRQALSLFLCLRWSLLSLAAGGGEGGREVLVILITADTDQHHHTNII